jgi:hypothetical protein
MGETMKFCEAFLKMNPDDAFDMSDLEGAIIKHENGYFFWNDDKDNPIPFNDETAILEGKIIPAEPKVLSADELFKKMRLNSIHTEVEYGEAMHQNGRLERDLELMPLIDAIKSPCSNVDDWLRLVGNEVENIKPLNSDENS